MGQADILRYLNGIESQHRTKPRYIAHVEKILEKVDAGTIAAADMPAQFNIAEAVGKQLDILGQIAGVSRTINIPGSQYYGMTVNDEQYRALLYAKIFANQWDGTNQSLREIWDATLGNIIDATYIDNQNMTVTVDINQPVESLLLELILAGLLIPKPMGVGMCVIIHMPTVENTLHFGGTMSIMPRLQIPQIEDALDFKRGVRIGDTMSIMPRLPIPQTADAYRFAKTVRAGGAMQKVSRLAIHEIPTPEN